MNYNIKIKMEQAVEFEVNSLYETLLSVRPTESTRETVRVTHNTDGECELFREKVNQVK